MDINTATEQAYRNGYEEGKRDAEPKWISVTERLPQNFVSVLAYIPCEHPLPTVKEAYLADGSWVTRTSLFFTKEVTHWMPLPNPPTE